MGSKSHCDVPGKIGPLYIFLGFFRTMSTGLYFFRFSQWICTTGTQKTEARHLELMEEDNSRQFVIRTRQQQQREFSKMMTTTGPSKHIITMVTALCFISVYV